MWFLDYVPYERSESSSAPMCFERNELSLYCLDSDGSEQLSVPSTRILRGTINVVRDCGMSSGHKVLTQNLRSGAAATFHFWCVAMHALIFINLLLR
jgi:hypothetical protein